MINAINDQKQVKLWTNGSNNEEDFAIKTQEEIAKDEKLKQYDISYKNLYLSLGIFGIFFGILLFAFLFYFLIRLIARKVKCCGSFEKWLKAKLFYSVYIQYIIESNLKITHNCICFLYVSGSFEILEDQINSSLRIVLLAIIVAWPFFLIGFLNCNRKRLHEVNFKQKFWSMYTGVKVTNNSAITYTSVFSLRRLRLVLLFLGLRNKSIWLICTYNAL